MANERIIYPTTESLSIIHKLCNEVMPMPDQANMMVVLILESVLESIRRLVIDMNYDFNAERVFYETMPIELMEKLTDPAMNILFAQVNRLREDLSELLIEDGFSARDSVVESVMGESGWVVLFK